MISAALALARRGFRVFPLKPGAKSPPLVKDFPHTATTDESQISKWWSKWPTANVAIEGSGYIIIDVDVKKGGDESLAFLEMTYGLPDTFVTRTPTGGRHLFFRCERAVPNSVAALGAGLDVRSENGYVVAPGSTVPAGDYRIEAEAPIADAPDWLILKLGTIMPKLGTTAKVVPDAPDSLVDRARDWLTHQDGAVEGQGGDARTYAVACGLRDLGLSANQAFALLQDGWNERCSPPWMLDDLWVRVENAYRYAQNEPGVAAAAPDDFPVVDAPAVQPAPRTRVRRLKDFAASEVKGPGYLVKGLLQRRSYAEAFGAPGAGKTFVALDLAYHVAAGLPWMTHKVHAGPVLYLAYEGTGGMVKRAQALRQKYGQEDVPLYIAGAAFSLREPAGRAECGRLIAELPSKPVLIVIDTFARALMGGDENSAQDVGAFNSAIAALIENTGACVMIIHHSGKNKNAGARGSSALLGAIDTELEVDENRVTASKQRDVEMGEPVGFKLVPVVVGVDEDGDELTSCVVEPDVVVAGPHGRLNGNVKRGFDALCELRPTNEPVVDSEWREACRAFLGDKGLSQRFYDIKVALRKKQYIVVDSQGMVTRRLE